MRKRIYVNAIIVFVFIELLGFGVMNAFWFTLPRDTNLLGLYHYRAATIGDGLFLPLLVATLSYFILKSYQKKEIRIKKKYIVMNHGLGVLAGIVGLLWQLRWLSDENIVPNWTIPRAGYFNIAGWYHAFFFVFMFYIITFLLIRVLLIRNYLKIDCKEPYEIMSFFLIWLSGSGFLFMIGLDDLSNTFGPTNLLVYIYFIFNFVFIIINAISVKKINYIDCVCVLAGSTSSLGIGLMMLERQIVTVNLLLIIALSLFSLAYIIIDVDRITRSIVYSLIIFVTVFLINMGIASTHMNLFFVFISILIPVLISIGQLVTQKNKKLVPEFIGQGLVLHILLIVSLIVYNFFQADFKKWINLVIGVVVGFVLKTAVTKIFNFVKEQEKIRNLDKNDVNQFALLKSIKKHCYGSIILIVIGGFIYLFLTLYNMIDQIDLKDLFEFNIVNSNLNKIYVCFTILLLCTTILICKKNIRRASCSKFKIFLFGITVTTTYVSLFFILWYIRGPFVIDLHPTNIFLVFMSLGSALMIAESFYSNVIRIRGYSTDAYQLVINFRRKKYDVWVVICTIVIFCGCVLTIYASLLPSSNIRAERSSSIIYFAIGILGCLYSVVGVPTLLARIIKLDEVNGVPTTRIVEGVWQSGFLVSIIIILGGGITVYFKSIADGEFEFWSGILMIISYVYWPLSFCLKNNVEHLKEQSKIYLADETNTMLKRQYMGLKFHIKFQNVITMIALLLYSLAPLVGHFISCLFAGKVNEFLKDYWPQG